MQLITIGTKNQIVLPKEVRRKINGLQPGNKVKIYSLTNQSLIIKVDTQNWLENSYGLMKKAWNTINPIKEAHQTREEW